jgi:hypothetical protein
MYSDTLLLDRSFVAVEENKCVGVCFLPIENIQGTISISLAGGYTIAPLSINERVEKELFSEIDAISREHNVSLIKFYLDPLIIEYQDKFNHLRKYHYIDSSSSDCLVDLTVNEDMLWSNIRKSYKPLINGILKNNDFEIVIIDRKSSDYTVHEQYRELHRKCSGRETRIKTTFDKQFEMLENDNASLFGLKYKGNFIGFNYFFHYQKTVVYASGADDPEYETSKIPIYHPILWSAIQYYKERNFEFIQFSQPCGYSKVAGFDDYLDEKQLNISLFKRGLGATTTPLFRGIKYYNQNLFLQDIQKFQEKILNV